MPVTVKKVDGFRVSTPGSVKAKNTTKAKALSQQRLLNAVEHNPNFAPRGTIKRNFGIKQRRGARQRTGFRQRSNFGIRKR